MPNELELWKGEVDFPRIDWEKPREEEPEVVEEEPEVIEGKFRDVEEEPPPREGLRGKFRGWREGRKVDFIEEIRKKARKWGFPEPETYEEAEDIEGEIKRYEEFGESERRAKVEEAKAHERGFRRKYRREPLKTFSKAYKAIAGPKHPVSREWYIPKAQAGLYVPKMPGWRPTTEQVPAGEAHRPELGPLRRAGSPPPSTPIKAPFRDVERFEGLGTAMSRLRGLEKLPRIDQAVYSEIHANGDIDTPSHIKEEVGQLGFSRREIDVSLKRLRDLGLITPTGQESNGEKELMVIGD